MKMTSMEFDILGKEEGGGGMPPKPHMESNKPKDITEFQVFIFVGSNNQS